MRSLTFWSVLLLACLITTPAISSDLDVHQHNAQGSLSWRDAGHVLDLHSDVAKGIVVTRTDADGTWGLRQGDVILAVDGHPVRQIEALVDRLRASKPAAVEMRVRRGRAEQQVTVTAKEYGHLVGPKPPIPPPPPASPAAPPAPPAPPSGN